MSRAGPSPVSLRLISAVRSTTDTMITNAAIGATKRIGRKPGTL
jgi:hypothetical protein